MAYSFYGDDEDELNRYLERFASGGRQDLAYEPGYGFGGGGGGGDYAAMPMREDNRSWLEKNGFPLLMAAGSVAAAFADKSGRRGANVQHALGQIAGAQLQSEQADRDAIARDFELDRRAWQQAQGRDMDREMAGMRFASEDADRDLRASEQALRGRQSDELHQRFMQANDPHSPRNQADLRRALAEAQRAELEADPNYMSAQQRAAAEDRDLQRQAMSDARAATLAQQRAEAQWRHEQATAQNEANRLKAEEVAFQKSEVVDQKSLDKFRGETDYTRRQLPAAMDISALRSRGEAAGDIPGVGLWDSMKPNWVMSDDDRKMRGQLADMADLVLRQRSGAAAPSGEVAKIANIVAAGDSITERDFQVLNDAYNQALRADLQQQSVGREDQARRVLGGEASNWAGIPLPQQSAPPQASQPGDTVRLGQGPRGAPSGGRVNFPDDRLPVTDQRRRDVPMVDDYLQGQGAQSGMVEIEGDMYSPDEAEILRRMGVIR